MMALSSVERGVGGKEIERSKAQEMPCRECSHIPLGCGVCIEPILGDEVLSEYLISNAPLYFLSLYFYASRYLSVSLR